MSLLFLRDHFRKLLIESAQGKLPVLNCKAALLIQPQMVIDITCSTARRVLDDSLVQDRRCDIG
ncbi:hypothetical protein SAMN05880582_101569 [Rhizobium sp. RU20A]|nr:hypothetical protein SAMN05880582_101569 [Rhizobium sp. RU20A]